MKKSLLGMSALIALLVVSCGPAPSYFTATSETVALGKHVLVHPTVAELNVGSERISAVLEGTDLNNLSLAQAKETAGAKALKAASADVLVAPRYELEYNAEKKLSKVTVIGYAATYARFRPATSDDLCHSGCVATDKSEESSDRRAGKVSNTQIIAVPSILAKAEVVLSGQTLAGLDAAKSLKKAKEQLIRETNADFLIAENHELTVRNGVVESIKFTAFPGIYQSYRTATKADAAFHMTKDPKILFTTIGDLRAIGAKTSVKCNNNEIQGLSSSQMESKVRNKALNQLGADVILNEYFQYEYAADGKSVSAISIVGTPAIYSNFRAAGTADVLDPTAAVNADGIPDPDQKLSIWEMFLNLFKKKK